MEYKIYLEGMTANLLKHSKITSVYCTIGKFKDSDYYKIRYKIKRGRKEYSMFVPKKEFFMAVIY